ncbi:MAG: lipocalin family protein [Chitinophagaceae bacterium]|nr:lipocalin family protein [Chitinophagaceae bacterium]
MKRYLPILIFITILSCKKEAIDNTPALLSKSWKMTNWTILTPFQGTPLQGLSNNWYSPGGCYSDMIWTYKRDGSFQNEPPVSCGPGTANGIDTFRGNWTLIDNSKTIKVQYIGGGPADFEFKIIEITTTKMVVQRVERTGVGGSQIMDLLSQYEFQPK